MRGLLIVNPKATGTNGRITKEIVDALSRQFDFEVVITTHAGQAQELAEQARRDNLDVVLALGGDGTINEIVNGLLSDGPGPHVPILAVIPGGYANALASAVGMPRDPADATRSILTSISEQRFRSISLGHATVNGNPRWFTMSVGMGVDAEIIKATETQRAAGKRAKTVRYLVTTVRQVYFETDRKEPPVTIERSDGPDVDHVFMATVQNAAPLTFLGRVAINPCPFASLDEGLDVFAVRDLGVLRVLRFGWRMLMGSKAGSTKGLFVGRDIAKLTLRARQPTAVQMDGESLGEHEHVEIVNVPEALRIIV